MRQEVIQKMFDENLAKLDESINGFRLMGVITGDTGFNQISSLLEIVITAASNNDLDEMLNIIMPFVQAKADAERMGEAGLQASKAIDDLIRGLNDPSKLN